MTVELQCTLLIILLASTDGHGYGPREDRHGLKELCLLKMETVLCCRVGHCTFRLISHALHYMVILNDLVQVDLEV